MSRPVCSRAVFLSLLPTGLLPVKASGMVITWLVIALVSSCLPSRIAAQEAGGLSRLCHASLRGRWLHICNYFFRYINTSKIYQRLTAWSS